MPIILCECNVIDVWTPDRQESVYICSNTLILLESSTFFQKGIISLGTLLTRRTVGILLALFELLALFLTGALGGIMV
jgi:hypothetical protein